MLGTPAAAPAQEPSRRGGSTAARQRGSAAAPEYVSPTAAAPSASINIPLPRTAKVNRDAVAVVIGNRNYAKNNADVPDVSYAHNDAELMKRYLVETLGYREGNIIFLKDAAQGQMVATFGNDKNPKGTLYNWVRPGQSDVFVYYSGHGAPGMQNGKGYLLPVDANPAAVELNGYPLDVLYQNLAQVPARSLTVVIDACFSGGSEGGSIVKNASSIALRRVDSEFTLSKGAVFTAAGLSEVASWDKESELGLFTRYFLEGVSGQADKEGFGNKDGQVTAAELKSYLESEVSYMARRLYMREQHPQVSGNGATVLSSLQ